MDLLNKAVKLFPDVSCLEIEQGVKIYSKKGSILIQDQAIYPIVLQLFRKLDGKQKVNHFLPTGPMQAQILRLIHLLLKYGFAKVLSAVVSEAEKNFSKKHPVLYDLLSNHVDNPYASFKVFSQLEFVCFGSGSSLKNILCTLIEHGATRFKVYSSYNDLTIIMPILNDAKLINNELKFGLFIIDNFEFSPPITENRGLNNVIYISAFDNPKHHWELTHKWNFQNSMRAMIQPNENYIHAFVIFKYIKPCEKCINAWDQGHDIYTKFNHSQVATLIASQYIVISIFCYCAGILNNVQDNHLIVNQESLVTQHVQSLCQCDNYALHE